MKNKAEIFKNITDDMLAVYAKKNLRYGDSFAKLRNEYPLSICMRLADKLNRLKTLKENPNLGFDDESIRDTLLDMANYAVMELVEMDKERMEYEESLVKSQEHVYDMEEPNGYEHETCTCKTHQLVTDASDSVTFQGREYSNRRETCFD